ncbi:MAG: prenyltransferase [Candidatus Omnitrophota bacterium]
MGQACLRQAGMPEYAAAMRLPFLSASVLPFIFGSLVSRRDFNIPAFLLGLACVIFTHLGSNLINDYADSKSGVDWQDLKPYKFFGGSKFIQSGLIGERFYFRAAAICFILALCCCLALSVAINRPVTVLYYLAVMVLGWSYSHKPLKLSYRRLGEPAVFLLFGPSLVMGGYFIQTGIFPDAKSLLLSLPMGFLTAGILFANEIPDFPDDKKCGKMNWVSFSGPEKAYVIYLVLMACAFGAIGINLAAGFLGKAAYFSFIFILPAIKAAAVLRGHYREKEELVISSKLTILVHALVSLALTAGVFY